MLAPLRERYPITDRLEIHLTSYSVHLIVALIILPSLIWHVFSVNVLDDYGMPDDWEETFRKTQFTGGRGWLWGFLFALIPLDCIHALLALDYYHGRRFERGQEGHIPNTSKPQVRRHRAFTSVCVHPSASDAASKPPSAPIVPLPTRTPETHHPLLRPVFPPPLRLSLITIYDITISIFLIIHITAFFKLLSINWDDCSTYTSPYPENFMDPLNTSMSVLERCRRICTDMYVSGGFDIALCVILLGVHLWHMAVRALEVITFGIGQENKSSGQKVTSTDGSEEIQRLVIGHEQREAQSTAIRYSGRSAEGGRKRARVSVSDESHAKRDRSSSVESARWSEVLLECLVP